MIKAASDNLDNNGIRLAKESTKYSKRRRGGAGFFNNVKENAEMVVGDPVQRGRR